MYLYSAETDSLEAICGHSCDLFAKYFHSCPSAFAAWIAQTVFEAFDKGMQLISGNLYDESEQFFDQPRLVAYSLPHDDKAPF